MSNTSIDQTINSNIFTNNAGKITAASLAATLFAITAWVVATFIPLSLIGTYLPGGLIPIGPQEFYVAVNGNDGFDCKSPATACQTVAGGLAAAYKYDAGGRTMVVNVGAGTFAGAFLISGPNRGYGIANSTHLNTTISYLQINGAGANNTIIDSAANDTACGTLTENEGANVLLSNLTIQQSQTTACFSQGASSSAIFLQNHAYLAMVAGMNFGATVGQHMHAEELSNIEITAAYTISGGAGAHWAIGTNSVIANDGYTVTCNGSYTFTAALLFVEDNGVAQFLPGSNFSGCSGTVGPRFWLFPGGLIDGNGISGFFAALPGSAATNIRYPGTNFFPMPTPSVTSCANGALLSTSTDDLAIISFTGSASTCTLSYAIPKQASSICAATKNSASAVGVQPAAGSVVLVSTFINGDVVDVLCHPLQN